MEIEHGKSVIREKIINEETRKWNEVREGELNTKLEVAENSLQAKIDLENSNYDLKMADLQKKRSGISKKAGLGGLGWCLLVFNAMGMLIAIFSLRRDGAEAFGGLIFFAALAFLGFLLIKRGKEKSNALRMYDEMIREAQDAHNESLNSINREVGMTKASIISSGNDRNVETAKQRSIERVAEYDMKVNAFRDRIVKSASLDLGFITDPVALALKDRFEALKIDYPGNVYYIVCVEYEVQLSGIQYVVHDGLENHDSNEEQKQIEMIQFSDNRMQNLSDVSQCEGLALALAEKIDKRICQVFEHEKYKVEYSHMDSRVTIKMGIDCPDNKIELKGWDEGKGDRKWEDVSQNDRNEEDSQFNYW